MTTEKPKPPEPEVESESAARDLRAELQSNLESEFTAKLEANRTLPDAASKSLVALLNARGPTAADVIEALALEDPIKPEVTSE